MTTRPPSARGADPATGNTPPGASRPPLRPLIPPWLWWLLLVGSIAWNVYALFVPKTPPTATLTYSAFLQAVAAGDVASVTMNGQAIDGTFAHPLPWPPAPSGAPSPSPATPGPTSTAVHATTYTAFSTVLPPTGDPALLPLLERHGVIVSAIAPSGPSLLAEIVVNALPMLLFVGLLVVMGRQMQSGQQTLFRFGSSHARAYEEERPSVTFADAAGADEAKAELVEIVSFLREPERFRALGARLPRGVLLVGPPGTGKTLLARAVAGEARVPFFAISASEFVEMFVGVGASRVRSLFDDAKKKAPAIVFVDEIDAVGRQRGAGLGGGNDEREQTLNQLLVEMDGFDDRTNVIVIAATNRPDVLDPALLRPGRFDRQVTVTLPDRVGRQAILAIHTRPLPMGSDVDLALLARMTPGFSGADLANLANEAALSGARRGAASISMADFEQALDKIVLGTRQASLLSQDERRLVAYHEAGHAVVARLTPGADPVSKITIIPHGRALGVTEQLPDEDRHTYTLDYLLGRLAGMLGGRAAEDLVFGQPTTGAESDLKQATALARRMVGVWGMSDEVGMVSYGLGETHPFLGRELAAPREYAEATASALDLAVRGLIERGYARARATLETHRALLDALANELVLHETVGGPQLDALITKIAATGGPPGGERA